MRADDPRLDDLSGGYRLPFDPRPDLRALEDDPDDVRGRLMVVPDAAAG